MDPSQRITAKQGLAHRWIKEKVRRPPTATQQCSCSWSKTCEISKVSARGMRASQVVGSLWCMQAIHISRKPPCTSLPHSWRCMCDVCISLALQCTPLVRTQHRSKHCARSSCLWMRMEMGAARVAR
eukprot:2732325-Amphidinium_carterae.1